MEEMAEDWENCCPLCMEEMDSTDRQLKPCRCGYQICVWCWNHIMEMAEKDSTEGRCPACRTPYDKEKIVSTAVSYDKLSDSNDKKQKPGKAKIKVSEGRRNLSNVRVIQRNLVYVVGIPATLADEETLERKEYFGQYGKILKISVSKPSGQHPQNSSAGASVSVYVTYVKEEDALRCIQAVNGCMLEGKVLKACFGTTKYCNSWLKNMPCNNPDCLYLHDEGTREDSFTKEEMLAKYGSKNQQFHDLTHPPQRRSGIGLPPPAEVTSITSTSNPPSASGSMPIKGTSASMSLSKSSSLPAAASWGSRTAAPRLATVKNGVGPVTSKLTAGTSSVTLTGPGALSSGPLSSSNSDATKAVRANNEGGGLFRPSEPSVDSSQLVQVVALSTGADNACIDLELRRKGQTSHSRKSSDVEASNSTPKPLKEGKPVKLSCNNVSGVIETAVLEQRDLINTPSVMETSTKHSVGESTPFIEFSQVSNDKFQMLRDPATAVTHGNERTLDLDNRISQPMLVNSETSTRDPPDGSSTTEVHRVTHSQFSSQTPFSVDNLSASLHSAYDTRPENDGESPANDPWLHGDGVHNHPERAPFTKNHTTFLLDETIFPGKADSYECETSEKKGPDILSEQELISDMFATDFDIWTDGSPQDLAQLLLVRKNVGFPASRPASTDTTAPWKTSSGSKQSRFHFARQDESTEGILSSNKLVLQAGSGSDRSMLAEKASIHNFSGGMGDITSSDRLLNKLQSSSGGSTTSYLSTARSPMSAPPGFSSIRASSVPPPGFAQHRRSENRQTAEVSNGTSGSFNQLQALDNLADVEFIDPAIMAVGRGKLPAGSSSTIPSASTPSLSAFLSQASPLSQQPRPLDFESSYQSHPDRPYRNYTSMNSISYSNQDLDPSLPSLFHKSFNESRFPAQYHDAMLPGVVIPESVYGNGVHEPNKLRLQHSTSWDDWSRISDLNAPRHQSVNDAVGRLAMSQLSLDRVLQSRLEELALSKDLGSKHYGDVGLPNGHEEQGSLSSARIGRYF